MYFCIEENSDFKSRELPESVERALRVLSQQNGEITAAAIAAIRDPSSPDSNMDRIGDIFDCEVIASGSNALRAVLDGLSCRLNNPIEANEKILVRGG